MGQWSEVAGWVEGECQSLGSGAELEGSGLVLYMLFWDGGAELDCNSTCDFVPPRCVCAASLV